MDKKDTSHLEPDDFNRFLNAIPKLSIYDSIWKSRAPLTPYQCQLYFKITYYCALGIKEAIDLTKSDFDLENKLLNLQRSKKTRLKQTTIPPNLVGELRAYLSNLNGDEKLFEPSRATPWKYAKEAGRIAGLEIFKKTKQGSIEGLTSAIFRHSYGLQMVRDGAKEEFADLKLRTRSETNYGGYTLEDVKEWEKEHFLEVLSAEEIEKRVKWYADRRSLYEKLAKKVEQVIRDILDPRGITYHYINSRAKEVESFREKIQDGIQYKPEEMQDLAGIRVICYVKSEVDEICKIIEKNFDIDKIRSQDKSKILGKDKMGYQSIHYIAKFPEARTNLDDFKQFENIYFEIQVRTILQHAWAEIEHDEIYKSIKSLPKNITRQFNLVSSVLEMADNEFERLHNRENVQELITEIQTGLKDVKVDITGLVSRLKKIAESTVEQRNSNNP